MYEGRDKDSVRLLSVDLEGPNDGRATKTIIPKFALRKVVSLAECMGDPRRILTACLVKIIVRGGFAVDGFFARELCKFQQHDEGYLCSR
jgi:hypothetical protein